ncbi:hypothetical protein ACFVTZ_04115 [Cellulosimicrobium cellulans]|uniref:hypothetical protein n=1 Tax=Cellulosimicrobium cellulans TaxID=1710 RepID=UPI0036E51AC5
MPTFEAPLADAAEASAALRGLAHATRTFENPAGTYPVIGDLLAGVRSLRQVLDQLAAAHISARAGAYDDAGDQAAGATSALAAADELHQAGTLLDTVHDRLDAAMSHSGRIAWHPAPGPAPETVHSGTLTLTVWPDDPLGGHHRYAYRIEDQASGQSTEGRDLFTGMGAPVSPSEALRDLAVYLGAAVEARQRVLDNPGTVDDGPFDEWTAEVARCNAHPLARLAEHGPAPTAAAEEAKAAEEAGRRWISVVFLQGSEADEVLDLIDRDGTDAAIEHLAGHDFGEETTQAALENGYVYARPPAGTLDRTASRDDTLVHNPSSGYVSLYRAFTAAPELAPEPTGTPPAINAFAKPLAPAAGPPARSAREAAAEADWFARRPGTNSAQGRGLAL